MTPLRQNQGATGAWSIDARLFGRKRVDMPEL
jgi:hypothetical protein